MSSKSRSVKRKLSDHEEKADLVSIIMPVYNAAPFLAASLESVINQSHRPLELSVYVDASDDGSAGILLDSVPRLNANGVAVLISDCEHTDCISGAKRVIKDGHEAWSPARGAGCAH